MNPDWTIVQHIQSWLDDSELLPSTKADYAKKVLLWFEYLINLDINPDDAVRSNVLAYKSKLQAEGKSKFTINTYITSIKRFYNWAEEHSYHENIAAGISNFYGDKGIYYKLPLSTSQAQELVQLYQERDTISLRNKAIISLMLTNGLRTCEVERMNVQDIAEVEGVAVAYIQRKGRTDKSERITLAPEVVRLLQKYIKKSDYRGRRALFVKERKSGRGERIGRHYISVMIKNSLRKIGIDDKRICAHSLRHTFGTMMVEQNVDIKLIQEMLGHSNIKTTEIYVGIAMRRKLLHNSPVTKLQNRIFNDEKNQN